MSNHLNIFFFQKLFYVIHDKSLVVIRSKWDSKMSLVALNVLPIISYRVLSLYEWICTYWRICVRKSIRLPRQENHLTFTESNTNRCEVTFERFGVSVAPCIWQTNILPPQYSTPDTMLVRNENSFLRRSGAFSRSDRGKKSHCGYKRSGPLDKWYAKHNTRNSIISSTIVRRSWPEQYFIVSIRTSSVEFYQRRTRET